MDNKLAELIEVYIADDYAGQIQILETFKQSGVETLNFLFTAFRSRNPLQRVAVIMILALFYEIEQTKVGVMLLEALQDEDWRVRYEALSSINIAKMEPAILSVIVRLNDEQEEVRNLAVEVLNSFDNKSLQNLLDSVKDTELNKHLYSIITLSRFKN